MQIFSVQNQRMLLIWDQVCQLGEGEGSLLEALQFHHGSVPQY